jgi:hypothetical protein
MYFDITRQTELQLIPLEYRTLQLCKEILNKNIFNIIFVPDDILETLDMINTRDDILKRIFKNTPDEYKTQNMCNKVVELEPLNLEYVPENYKTVDIINVAYNANKKTIKFIPKEQCTYQMYFDSVCSCNSVLDAIPIEHKTKEIFQKVASKTDKTLEEFLSQIQEEQKASIIDEDLYVSWLKSTNMTGFDQIPNDIKTASFYEKCIAFSLNTLKYMPVEMFNPITMKITEALDFHNNFATIPSNYITEDIQLAYESTSEFWVNCLKSSGYSREVFERMPSKYKTENVFKMFALKRDDF